MCTYVKKLTDILQIHEYLNTCYRCIWYEKYGEVFFVITYHCNVSVNSSWICININSMLLGSSSSPTTQIAGTSDIIHESVITPDATSGRLQL